MQLYTTLLTSTLLCYIQTSFACMLWKLLYALNTELLLCHFMDQALPYSYYVLITKRFLKSCRIDMNVLVKLILFLIPINHIILMLIISLTSKDKDPQLFAYFDYNWNQIFFYIRWQSAQYKPLHLDYLSWFTCSKIKSTIILNWDHFNTNCEPKTLQPPSSNMHFVNECEGQALTTSDLKNWCTILYFHDIIELYCIKDLKILKDEKQMYLTYQYFWINHQQLLISSTSLCQRLDSVMDSI